MKSTKQNIINCNVGKGTKVYDFVNLYRCTIGQNCMIGAGSVVTKDVKSNTTVVGVPARKL